MGRRCACVSDYESLTIEVLTDLSEPRVRLDNAGYHSVRMVRNSESAEKENKKMNTKNENQVSEKVQQNAKARAAVHEKQRAANAENRKKQLNANQKRDRFGSLDGVGVIPVTGENGVTNGYAVGMLVSEVKANGKTRRGMVTLQEALEGAAIYAADFNKWTKHIFKERFIALVKASEFAKYAGMSLLPKEAEALPAAEKEFKKWKEEKEAEKKTALDAWGRLSENLAKQGNGTEKAKWLFSELLNNLPEGAEFVEEIEESLKNLRDRVIFCWINQ